MTNPYYNHSDGIPQSQTRGASAQVRAEFDIVQTGFDKLPPIQNLYAGGANFAADTGTANTMQVALNAGVTAYFDGMEMTVKAAYANTGPATLTINGLVAKPIQRVDGTALFANDIMAGQIAVVRYSATTGVFQYSQTSAAQIAAAQASATNAGTSASTASTNASSAFTSATNAASSATAAAGSASAAAAAAAGITYPIPIASGGTGQTTAAAAITALGGLSSASPTINTPTINSATVTGTVNATGAAVSVTTQVNTDSSNLAASTAYVKAVVTGGSIGFTPVQQGGGTSQDATAKVYIGKDTTVNKLRLMIAATDLGLVATESYVSGAYAPLASPTFTGTVTAPTFSGALSGNATTATTATSATTATNATTAANATNFGGQLPSYYQVALGYTPANRAGDTFTGTVYTPLLYASGAGATLVVNSTSNVYAKQLFQDSGVTRGLIGANASYCFAAINAANTLAGFTVDNSGNCVAAANVSAGRITASNDIMSYRAVSQGYVYLGSDTVHYIGFDGTNYVTGSSGGFYCGGAINAAGGSFSSTVLISTAGPGLTINATNSAGIKIGLQDAGTARGYVYADVSYCGGWVNAANNLICVKSDNSGNLSANGNITANSDERLKTNWRDLAVDFIDKLATVKHGIYDRTDMTATQTGVSAQSLQALLPQAVQEDEKGILSVAYGNAALVACIELAKRVLELEAKLAAL